MIEILDINRIKVAQEMGDLSSSFFTKTVSGVRIDIGNSSDEKNILWKRFNFPSGEIHIEIDMSNFSQTYGGYGLLVYWDFEDCKEIIEVFFLCEELHHLGHQVDLVIPYFPFSRQDRRMHSGDCFSLGHIASLINNFKYRKLFITDPNSEVTAALLKNVNVMDQHDIFLNYFQNISDFFLISPDGGALKKIYKLAERVDAIEVVECSKRRDLSNGDITGTTVHKDDFEGKDCYIVDDICDGGRTFIEIAKILKKRNAGKVILMVSHGFFTKGLDVFDGLIDEIYTRKGQVK